MTENWNSDPCIWNEDSGIVTTALSAASELQHCQHHKNFSIVSTIENSINAAALLTINSIDTAALATTSSFLHTRKNSLPTSLNFCLSCIICV